MLFFETRFTSQRITLTDPFLAKATFSLNLSDTLTTGSNKLLGMIVFGWLGNFPLLRTQFGRIVIMKRFAYVTLAFALLSVPFALAGEGHHCKADAQACINKIAEKAANKGWMGVELDEAQYATALIITKVVPDSPAAKANLQPGERLVALNGIKYGSDESKMAEAYKAMTPGNTVTMTIGSAKGVDRQVKITLAAMPEDVVAKWLGQHMLQSHAVAANIN